MAKIKIRETKASDAAQRIALHNLVWRYAYKNIFPEEVFVAREAKTQKRIEDFAKYSLSNKERISLVAEEGGNIVGLMSGLLTTQYEYFAKQGYAELQALYIHPDYQHLGLGTSLKNEFEKWARHKGATKYVVGVLGQNEAARKVYKRWGGKLSRRKNPMNVGGNEYEERFYTFDL